MTMGFSLPHELLFTILILLTLPAQARGRPGNAGNHTLSLQPRQCEWDAQVNDFVCDDNLPTLKQMVDRMRNPDQYGKADADHSAVFYSGLGGFNNGPAAWIKGWLKSVGLDTKCYWLMDAIDMSRSRWFVTQVEFVKNNQEKYKSKWGEGSYANFMNCYYQALSLAAVHPEAYIFAPKDVEFRADSTWQALEFPYLTQNLRVKRIYRVDPRPPDKGGNSCGTLQDREILWDRDRGDAVVYSVFDCPIRPP